MTGTIENVEDILLDSLEILGTERVEDPGCIQYGDLVLTVAPKVASSLRHSPESD